MNDMSTSHNQPDITQTESDTDEEQLQLARLAADGDETARRTINQLIHPVISYQTSRFCKRFCRENQYRYACTLQTAWGSPPADAVLCEWGNASYAWMLNDLTNRKRLLQFEGKNGARINDYLYHIANSLPFYERWKDWRFGRKIHVPTYIQDLNPDAAKVFLALRNGETVPAIAQKLGKSQQQTEVLCRQIIITLTRRKRLHLLDPPTTISLTKAAAGEVHDNDGGGSETEIASYDETPESREAKEKLLQAWSKLSTVEQFVLEAMLIEEQDASDVLQALKKLNISIKQGVAAEDTSRQQLYYFRRKTLAKLADLIKES